MHSDRLLLGPGPSNPFPEVYEAFTRPVLGHLDPEFLGLLDETCERLRTAFKTKNAATLPISATGSAGMEACVVNLVERGDKVIIGVNGVFGGRMVEVAERAGAEVIRVDVEWGQPVPPERLLEEQKNNPDARFVGVVHAETSVGVRSDIEPLKELQNTDTMLLVDCVTSLGGIPLEIDAWGVDAAYSGTQKCLGVPPGLSPVTFSERAVERATKRNTSVQSWYLDMGLIGAYVGSDRKYHHTAPVTMIYGLHAGLGVLLEEGLEASHERHRRTADMLFNALPEFGFRGFAQESHRLPQLTSVWLPDGLDDAGTRKKLLFDYSIEVGGGLGDVAGKIWRIGLMGHNAREKSVVTLLGALREVLG
ncbi:MAG: alanine--glyoxylate aminotransferase family protein [Actinomycetota bacterium]